MFQSNSFLLSKVGNRDGSVVGNGRVKKNTRSTFRQIPEKD